MIQRREDSIKELNERKEQTQVLKAKIAEQEERIGLLTGCIMELTEMVLGGDE